jgi:phosphatidylinositol alpha-1,6-mannosyltransferase
MPLGTDRPRRCLLVANVFPPVHGGSATVYGNLARHAGGNLSVLAPSRDYLTGKELAAWRQYDAAAPFPIHRLDLLRTRMVADLRLRDRVILKAQDVVIRLRLITSIARIRRDQNIGSLCIGELVAGGWLVRISRLLGLRTIIYVHGEEVSISDSYDFSRSRRRSTLARADAVVAVSRFARDSLIRLMGVESSKITLIPNGVDLASFAPRPRRADLVARYRLAGRQVLLTVGRLSERKGMDRVIESLPALRRILPDLVYLMVGDGPYRPALAALSVHLGVADATIFAGAVAQEELADHYALADVFIMANRALPDGDTEGFGLVFLEANACGIPVIAGCAGGSIDAVEDGVNGLVIDGDNAGSITAAVLKLFGDADLRNHLVQGGFSVASRSGWPDRVARFLSVCEAGPAASV